MKRMLMLASVASMIDQFNMPNIEILQKMGYQVEIACNFQKGNTTSREQIKRLQRKLIRLNIFYYQVDFARNIYNVGDNIKAYYEVERILKQKKYNFIHCHSPIGGAIGRLAAYRTRTKVIYTAHGFHFFEGAPLINWIVYYPIEKFLAKYTDVLITINQEDYKRAKKFRAKRVEYIPGVGVDTKKFAIEFINKQEKRKELGIKEDKTVLLSVGELNKNKNHEIILRTLAQLKDKNVYYLICGEGKLSNYIRVLSKELGIKDKVKLLGFQPNMALFYSIADIFVFPSYREGLSLALMEAMASGLPCIVSDIRGNRDLIEENKGGYLVEPNNKEQFKMTIKKLKENNNLRQTFSEYNKKKALEFNLTEVKRRMKLIYETIS